MFHLVLKSQKLKMNMTLNVFKWTNNTLHKDVTKAQTWPVCAYTLCFMTAIFKCMFADLMCVMKQKPYKNNVLIACLFSICFKFHIYVLLFLPLVLFPLSLCSSSDLWPPACDCDPVGSLEGGVCDSHTDLDMRMIAGQCRCKANVKGTRCDDCKEGYFGLSQNDPLGCQRTCVCVCVSATENNVLEYKIT